MVHAFQLLFIECNYPRAFVWWIGMHAVMFFFLFNEFYKQAYQNKRAAKAAALALSNGVEKKQPIQEDKVVKNGGHKVSDYYVNGADLHHRTTGIK